MNEFADLVLRCFICKMPHNSPFAVCERCADILSAKVKEESRKLAEMVNN